MDAGPSHVTGETTLGHADMVHAVLALPFFKQRWLYLACAALLVAVNVAMSGSGGSTLESFAPFLGFTGLFAAFLFAGPHLFARRTVVAMVDPSVRYDLSERAISVATKGTCVTWSWDEVGSFREEASVFLLWLRRGGVHVIPKRAFSPAGSDWLHDKLGRDVARHDKGIKRRARWVLLWLALVILFLAVWQILSMRG